MDDTKKKSGSEWNQDEKKTKLDPAKVKGGDSKTQGIGSWDPDSIDDKDSKKGK